MLGVPGDGGADAAPEGGAGGAGSNSGGLSEEERGRVGGGGAEEGERSSAAGNRWPRQETLALLKIRSDMDVEFRDSTLKGPLWEEVSRKLAAAGIRRSAKKCKEKFENVYKYHKRTKEGRASKADGKAYRFFDQLEALEAHSAALHPPLHQLQLPPPPPPPLQLPAPAFSHHTVPSAPSTMAAGPSNPPPSRHHPAHPARHSAFRTSNSTSSSSSTSSDETPEEDSGRRRKRRRKWKLFFERLMRDVIERQEELQRRFLEAIERRERERMVREEAWRVQEMARMNKEHEILVMDRAAAAEKDAALISFLQRMTNPVRFPTAPDPAATAALQVSVVSQPVIPCQPTTMIEHAAAPSASSSRWPKAEVEALINLRTDMDVKYQESGPKGPLWEEISAGMLRLGYNRNSKRCKEKWENINKYFKKVKESSKKRPEDSKTCPYFPILDELYRVRNRIEAAAGSTAVPALPAITLNLPSEAAEADPVAALMVRPEQQWPPLHSSTQHNNPNDVDDGDGMEEEGEAEAEEEEEYDGGGGGGYGMMSGNPGSAVGAARGE